MVAKPTAFSNAPYLIAIDWGTSNVRLWVMDKDGHVLDEQRSNKGMSQLATSDYPKVVDELLAPYDLPSFISIVICGMAGARAGWQEAPYLSLPACFEDLATHAVRLSDYHYPVSIIGGMAQPHIDKPDVMRGEETILYGAYLSQSFEDKAVICLPGTHSKWVHLDKNKVTSFTTFMTGELYHLISHHSLLSSLMNNTEFDEGAFCQGLQDARLNPQNLASDLFGLRAANLLQHPYADAPSSRLSGLLIGAEIAGALDDKHKDMPLYLLASGKSKALYQLAFDHFSRQHKIIEADQMAQIALFDIGKRLAG